MEQIEIITDGIEEKIEYKEIIKEVLDKCFKEEKLGKHITITVTLTNPENIRNINKKYRQIDNPTDVLSFPMYEKEEISEVKQQKYEVILGDIVISIPKVEEQAEEYGHSFKRELSYMVVHGFYHLMGFDHMKEEEKAEMREKEENILGKLNITGSIQGNSKAAEIYAENAKITGEVNSQGSVKIGQSSVVIGNISATSAVIAGAVKGDIDVHGPVILDTTAIVMGNIKSKSVQINNGAVIEGLCSQCYADVNPTSFFEEFKKKK